MARDLALEAAILESRDDPEPYLVYADWLASRGDPRGELIALQHRAELEPENGELLMYRDEYLRRHPGLRPALDMWQVQLGWRWGFIDHARIEDQSAAELQELLDHPSCRLLRRLKIVTPYNEGPALVRTLLASVRSSLESVTLEQDGEGSADPEHAPDAGSWSRLPRLNKLVIAGRALSRTLEHPTLQSLHILHGEPFGSEPPWNLPAVTAFSRGYPTHLDALWSAHLPSLRHLDLRLHDGLRLLEHGGFLRLLPQLETLRFSLSDIEIDEAEIEEADLANMVEQLHREAAQRAHLRELQVEQLLRQAARLAHLRELYVHVNQDGEEVPWARLRQRLRNLKLPPSWR